MTATVAFFISGHGFGHASRQVEIINALLGGPSPPRAVLRTSADPALLARTIRGPYSLIPGPCDPGIVQTDSVTPDDDASSRAIGAFYGDFNGHIEDELARLRGHDIDLIVGDIPPLAFAVAARRRVPSLAIANFTWDWIYEPMAGIAGAPGILTTIRDAYRLASRALALPFSGGFEVFARSEPLPLVARHATHTADETRTRLGLPRDRRIALLSFGAYGLSSLGVDAVDLPRDWTIVTADSTGANSSAAERVAAIAESAFVETPIRYEDLVAAADVVITKPGYGIIAECAANDTALVYTSRGDFREYDLLVGEMPRYVRCAFLSQPDLREGRWHAAVDAALSAARPNRPRSDGADVAARIIREMLAARAM